jgi:hypothetical protein
MADDRGAREGGRTCRKEPIAMPSEIPERSDAIPRAAVQTGPRAKEGRRQLDLQGRTITTAIVVAVEEELAELALGDEVELLTEPVPAIARDLEERHVRHVLALHPEQTRE